MQLSPKFLQILIQNIRNNICLAISSEVQHRDVLPVSSALMPSHLLELETTCKACLAGMDDICLQFDQITMLELLGFLRLDQI